MYDSSIYPGSRCPSDDCSLSSDLSVALGCSDSLVLAEEQVEYSQHGLEIAFDNIYREGREGREGDND